MSTPARVVLSALLWTLSVSTSIVIAQEPDGMEKGAKGFGQSAGSYAGQAIARQVKILQLTAELNRCGSCPQRADLESQLAALQLEDAGIKAMEGMVLRSLGLPYDSFGSLLGAVIEDFFSDRHAKRIQEEIFSPAR